MLSAISRTNSFLVISRSHLSALIVPGCRCMGEYSSHERSKYMQKLLNKKDGKSKKKWYQLHIAQPLEILGAKGKPRKSGMSQAQRIRATQLAHVLYEKITHIMNSGELSEEIFSKQVLVTSVKVHPDFEGINVFWDSSRSDAAEIEPLLFANSGRLRSLLISYHVLGRIPSITFVRDRSVGDITRLNQLLEVADYGPDYVPNSQHSKARGHDIRWGMPTEDSNAQAQDTRLDMPTEDSKTQEQDIRLGMLSGDSQSSHSSSVKLGDITVGEHSFPEVTSPSDGSADRTDEPHSRTESNPDLEADDSAVSLQHLQLRSNLYGLPHEELMKKILANKTRLKHEGTSTDIGEKTDFSTQLLSSQKEKLKLKSMNESTKLKQQLLDRDFEDIMASRTRRTDTDGEYDDDWGRK